jgi:Tol biopolymer transport system component
LVNLYGIPGEVVRDLADFDHPSTVCSIPACSGDCQRVVGVQYVQPRFVSSTRLSYFAYDSDREWALFAFDMQSGSVTAALAWHVSGILVYGLEWSPDGSQFTYLAEASGLSEWHIVAASVDRTLVRLGSQRTWGMVGFSADGRYVALEGPFDAASRSVRILRAVDGSTVKDIACQCVAVWGASGSRLYFQSLAGDVQVWDGATNSVATVVSGLRWSTPRASADGRYIVFSGYGIGASGIGLLDLGSGRILQPISHPRLNPRFLTSKLIWTSDFNGDKKYIFDLATGTESPSIDYLFFDSWPHTQAQS